MKIKKGDKVRIITAKDKYRADNKETHEHEVLACYPKENRILVKDVNVVTRHTKPRKAGQPGGRIKKEAPIDASNAMVICPKCGQPTRVGYRVEKQGDKVVKVRVCKKKVNGAVCGASLDK